MQDLLKNKDLGELLTNFHNNQKITGLTCHGTVAQLSTVPDARGYVAKLEAGQSPQSAKAVALAMLSKLARP